MVKIDIDMPHDCATCWVRKNLGCKIANASGWLNSRRDEGCPLIDDNIVTCKECYFGLKEDNLDGLRWCYKRYKYVRDDELCKQAKRGIFDYDEWSKEHERSTLDRC